MGDGIGTLSRPGVPLEDGPRSGAEETALETLFESLHREAFGQLVATLTRLTRDLALAEDVVQEAFVRAIQDWAAHGPPENPTGWLARTARNAAIDRLRRARLHDDRISQIAQASSLETAEANVDLNPILRDDMLRLLFTCCHPALAPENRVALSLRTLCGLETKEIASAFLISERTLAQRLVRAKNKIAQAGIAYRIPEPFELDERLPDVLSVVYLIFNEGYLASHGEEAVRGLLADQAIRLARTICALLPEQSEAESLLALMLLQNSRRAARLDSRGDLILLTDQDRSLWDGPQISEGLNLLHSVFARGQGLAPYAIQAAIAALHAEAPSPEATDWAQICSLYERLMEIDPSPVIALNHCVALAERDGAEAGLACINRLRESSALQTYHLYHATRADFLRRIQRRDEAAEAYQEALSLTQNEGERRFLSERLAEVQKTRRA